MRKAQRIVLATAMMVCGSADVWAQEPLKIKAQIIGRAQIQYSTSSVDEAELVAAGRKPSAIPPLLFEIRRARMGANVSFNDWLTGEVDAEVAMARLAMRNVMINMKLRPEFEVRMGQFKKPFSLMELNSEMIWPLIERGARIRGLSDALALADSLAGTPRALTTFRGGVVPGEEHGILNQLGYLSYDIGAMVHGRLGGFGYMLGAFNGEGNDRADTNGDKSFAARVSYQIGTDKPLVIAAAVSRRETRTQTRPSFVNADGTAYEVDFEYGKFRGKGLRLIGEVTTGENLAVADDNFFGVQAIVVWFKPVSHKRVEGIELAGRASYGDPRKAMHGDEALLLTPGFNLYFMGKNRLMINWELYDTRGARFSNENALRIQAQFFYN